MPEEVPVSLSALEDFVQNPVWKRMKRELTEKAEADLQRVMSLRTPLEEASLARLEYNLILEFLDKPAAYRGELKEDLR